MDVLKNIQKPSKDFSLDFCIIVVLTSLIIIPHSADDISLEPKRYRMNFISQ